MAAAVLHNAAPPPGHMRSASGRPLSARAVPCSCNAVSLPPSPSPHPLPSPTRAIVILAMAAFSSQAMVRVMDSLLPQVAADLNASVGATSIVVTMYMVSHGLVQLIIGPVGDRFGKFKTITFACAMASLLVMLCGFADSLSFLAMARLGSGLAAGWIIPLSLAYIGDIIPYERRQQVLGTYLSGQILGQLFGQAAGGVLGDLLGWRNVFFLLAGLFAIAAAALIFELATNPLTRT